MKDKMSSTKAWLIIVGFIISLPFLVNSYVKLWSVAYNLFY